MQIFVKTLTGKLITVDVSSSETVFHLKEKIQEKEDIMTEHLSLYYGGEPLEDEKTIRQSKIKKECTIIQLLKSTSERGEKTWCLDQGFGFGYTSNFSTWKDNFMADVCGKYQIKREVFEPIYEKYRTKCRRGMNIKRILSDVKDVYENLPVNVISLIPDLSTSSLPSISTVECEAFSRWILKIKGPVDSPYQFGIFDLQIDFPKKYPFVPMRIKFLTKIFHPLNGLETMISPDSYSPSMKPILFISALLYELEKIKTVYRKKPNGCFEWPLQLLKEERFEEFDKIASEWTRRYALGKRGQDVDLQDRVDLCCESGDFIEVVEPKSGSRIKALKLFLY